MKRTHDEILERIELRRKRDLLDCEWPKYLDVLPYEKAKKYLQEDYDGKDWVAISEDDIRENAIEYMKFAWEKANNCRGISASRSLSHYIAWLWLLGEDGFDDLDEYEFYGKPQLVRICEYLGLDHKQWDNRVRVNSG